MTSEKNHQFGASVVSGQTNSSRFLADNYQQHARPPFTGALFAVVPDADHRQVLLMLLRVNG